MHIRLSLGLKLGALVALILTAFSASYWLVHHELHAIERLYTRVIDVHDPALDAAYKLHLGHASIGLAVRDALAGTTTGAVQRIETAHQEFARNLALLDDIAEPALRPRLDELDALHRAYIAHAERIVELSDQRHADLALVVARLTGFKGVLVEALLPTALSPQAAAEVQAALDRLDETVSLFLLAPTGRNAWRADDALKFFQRDLAPTLAPDASTAGQRRAAQVRRSANRIDVAIRAAMRSTVALRTSLQPFDEQARMIDYRLSTRFEPTMRAAMRAAAAAALEQIRRADTRAALLLAAAVFVGSIVAFVVRRHVLTPLRLLLQATRAVASGHYRTSLTLDGHDEIASLGQAFDRMARTLEQTTVSRSLFDDVLHALDEALFVTAADGRIELANRAAGELTGREAASLVGQDIAQIMPVAGLDGDRRTPTQLRTRAGELPVLAARSPLASGGAAPRYVVTALDDSGRRAAERALAASRDELQGLHASLERRLEGERATLARELHDELGASLTTMKTLIYLAGNGRRDIGLTLDELGRSIDDMSDATTRIVNGLHPPVLDHFGLVAALDWYIGEFASRTGITCEHTLPDTDLPLAPDTALALFRAAQECLTNVRRHAQAQTVRITLEVADDTVQLDIVDDGVGCTPEQIARSERVGLRGLRERIRAIGGSLSLTSSRGAGLRACITAPCDLLARAA